MPRPLSREPATPPDLEESGVHGILPGSPEDAAAALHPAKSYGIRIAGVIPNADVGSLSCKLRSVFFSLSKKRYLILIRKAVRASQKNPYYRPNETQRSFFDWPYD
jgi:hypothetical protein